MRHLPILIVLLLPLYAGAQPPKASPGNRLAYLDELNPYYPHRQFPKLITPQWVGDPDVDAVVILAIDDMKEPKRYETYLRPILNRLKRIDGRAPVSIMTCSIDPQDPQLQAWLKEGLSIEVHTFDHPCPYFSPGFDKAKGTYDQCVDLMNAIPNNKPVCFRMPCCDSMNTPSPRHWAEIFNKKTAKGNYLSLDSSVFQVFTSNDPELPKELVLEDGKERFKKYLPMDRDFVNWIENYPYPYVIGDFCWQFPCMTPSDWQAQHLHKPNNPITLRDWKAALDCTVIKKGVFNMVFHPHGWIKADQVIELIDHAVEKHGKKVKFLTFKEAHHRLEKSLGKVVAIPGSPRGARLLDVNKDGYVDLIPGESYPKSRLWLPEKQSWITQKIPVENYGALCILQANGFPSIAHYLVKNGEDKQAFVRERVCHFDGNKWVHANDLSMIVEKDGWPRYLDIDGDGICEKIIYDRDIYEYKEDSWDKLPFQLPRFARTDMRFVDLNGDRKLDLVFSDEKEWGVYLFTDMKTGWRKMRTGKPGDPGAIPMIARNGKNNGCWAHSDHLWWANEDTHLLKNHVDRRSYKALLGME